MTSLGFTSEVIRNQEGPIRMQEKYSGNQVPPRVYSAQEREENLAFHQAMMRDFRWCHAGQEYGPYAELGIGKFYCSNPSHDHDSPEQVRLGPTREIVLRNTLPPSKGSRIKSVIEEPEADDE